MTAQGRDAGQEALRPAVVLFGTGMKELGRPEPGRRRAIRLLLALALVALTGLVFFPVARFEFINYDDPIYVFDNAHVTRGLTGGGIAWALGDRSMLWLPLTWISLMADVSLFGVNPGMHHLVNVLYHGAATVVLFLVLAAMTGTLWRSALVAVLFALHPLHVQSVAWISERKDVLCGFFLMLVLGAYLAYAKRPGPGRYLLVLLLFALGLMAKPMLVTVPLVLLLLDFWPLGRLFPRSASSTLPGGRSATAAVVRAVAEKLPLMLLAAGALIPMFLPSQAVLVAGRVSQPMIYPLSMRLVNSLVSFPFYVWKMLWPVDLSILYPHPRTFFPVWMVAVAVLMLIAASAYGLRAARRQPWLLMGWCWYVTTLIPVAGAVQIGDHVVADRYSYLPLVGLFIAVAWGGAAFLRGRPALGKALLPSAAVAILVLFALARREVGFWRNSLTIFGRAIEVTDGNYIALDQVGMAYASLGRPAEAIEKFRASIAAYPWRSSAHYNLGSALGLSGRTREAIESLNRAVLINPGDAMAHNNIGAAHLDLGRPEEAMKSIETALRLDPGMAQAHFNRGRASVLLGQKATALEEYGVLRQIDGRLAGELLDLVVRTCR